jgi:glycosyltransferase involved in cell wall biosynthesis
LDRESARRALGLSSEGLVIGWVGRLSPEKGPDLFLQALAAVDVPGLGVMVGDGAERARLSDLAGSLGLTAARVRFLGQLPEAAALLPAFDVVALTSRVEGTPMIILEAVAAGVPIVAFRTGGIPDLLTDETAWLVSPGDVSGLRAALRDALASPAEGKARAAAARARLADRLSLDRWVAKVRAVYQEARRQPAPRRGADHAESHRRGSA